jgi:hypothetical protein
MLLLCLTGMKRSTHAGTQSAQTDSHDLPTTGNQFVSITLCSANNFVSAELGIVSPSPAPSTSQGADTDSRRFYIAPDVRDHKQSMRIAAHEPKSINKHGPLSFNGEAINAR